MREEDPKARLYYLQAAKAQNWSVRQLQRQIETLTYQRLLSTQTSPAGSPEALPATPAIRDFIKDPYVLEFLGLPEDPTTSETVIFLGMPPHQDLTSDYDHFSWFMAVRRARQLLAVVEGRTDKPEVPS